MKYFITLTFIFIVIFFHKNIELFLINSTISWTISKALPYLLLIILGVYLAKLSFHKFKFNNVLKIITIVILMLAPFGIDFIFNPIYEGDFSKKGKMPTIEKGLNDFNNYDLVVITIPGCPYCHESTINSNKLLERNPSIKIKYVVCSDNVKEIEPYQRNLNKNIKVELASKPKSLAKIADGGFPSFVVMKNGKAIEKWSNDQFGVRAKDYVESLIK
jgi:hypothetical protein